MDWGHSDITTTEIEENPSRLESLNVYNRGEKGLDVYAFLESVRANSSEALELISGESIAQNLTSDIREAINTLDEIMGKTVSGQDFKIENLDSYVPKIVSKALSDQTTPGYVKFMRAVDAALEQDGLITDKYNGLVGHSLNTAIISTLTMVETNRNAYETKNLGKVMYSQQEIEQLIRASFLHDFGKISNELVDIWTSDEKITPSQMKLMEKHPIYSIEIIEKAGGNVDNEIIEAIRYHHENPAGTGYEGLKDEQISKGAALLGVADRWTAMHIDKRGYQGQGIPNLWKDFTGEVFGYVQDSNGEKQIALPENLDQHKFGAPYESILRIFNQEYRENRALPFIYQRKNKIENKVA